MSAKNDLQPYQFINWECAQHLIGNYNTHPQRLEMAIAGPNKVISGFRVSRAEIETLLANDSTQEIFIAFGHHSGKTELFNAGFTTVLFGLDSGNNLQVEEGATIIDYCEPCPDKCPVNVNLSEIVPDPDFDPTACDENQK